MPDTPSKVTPRLQSGSKVRDDSSGDESRRVFPCIYIKFGEAMSSHAF
jgi:hypothetical protein